MSTFDLSAWLDHWWQAGCRVCLVNAHLVADAVVRRSFVRDCARQEERRAASLAHQASARVIGAQILRERQAAAERAPEHDWVLCHCNACLYIRINTAIETLNDYGADEACVVTDGATVVDPALMDQIADRILALEAMLWRVEQQVNRQERLPFTD